MSDYLIIEGQKELKGEVYISGSKNASLPLMALSILSEDLCEISNVPILLDVQNMIHLLKSLGKDILFEEGKLKIRGKIDNFSTPESIVRKMRASILVLGPLAGKYKKAYVSMPGGCSIGARQIDQHLKIIEKAGGHITVKHGFIKVEAKKLNPVSHTFDIITVTGTENALMFLANIEGESFLRNIAIEPEVLNLIEALKLMGCDIELDTQKRSVAIKGTKDLKPFKIEVIPDRIEAGTFAVIGVATNSEIKIKNLNSSHLDIVLEKLIECGANIDIKNSEIITKKRDRLRPLKIKTSEYPGFPTDMQAQFCSLVCLVEGISEITETIFENRFQHIGELQRMGAKIDIINNTAIITGVKELSGAEVFSTDLRASASLIIAALVANGKSLVKNIYHLDRGYEKIEEKLKALGANIERIKSDNLGSSFL